MTEGSVQLRRYIAMRRRGVERGEAAHEVGFSLEEARMWDEDEAKGELAWVGPDPDAKPKRGGIDRITMKVGGGPEVDITEAMKARMAAGETEMFQDGAAAGGESKANGEPRDIVAEGLPSAVQLRSYIGRIERLNEEIAELNEDKTEIFKEAKELGFDTTVMKAVIKRRKAGEDATAQMDALIATYERAMSTQFELGLDS